MGAVYSFDPHHHYPQFHDYITHIENREYDEAREMLYKWGDPREDKDWFGITNAVYAYGVVSLTLYTICQQEECKEEDGMIDSVIQWYPSEWTCFDLAGILLKFRGEEKAKAWVDRTLTVLDAAYVYPPKDKVGSRFAGPWTWTDNDKTKNIKLDAYVLNRLAAMLNNEDTVEIPRFILKE